MIVGTIAKQIVEFSVVGLNKSANAVRITLELMRLTAVGTIKSVQLLIATTSIAAKVVKGLAKTVGAVGIGAFKTVKSVLGGINSLASGTMSRIGSIASAAQGIAKIGAGLGAGFLASFGRGAMEGTVEADRLGKAFTYLTRVVGDSLAPYVRMLTDYIVQAAQAYRAISPETKKTVTQVALFAAGIGTALVVLPTLITTVGALGAALAAIFSPAALAIAGIAALADAATGLFDFMRAEAPATADAVDEANRSWVDRYLAYIEKITIAGANFFNQMAERAAAGADLLADHLARAGEYLGILEKGTTDTIRKMENITPYKINIDNIRDSFGKIKRWTRETSAGIKQMQERADKVGGDKGFTRIFQVKFESLQGTFDRLQEAFAAGHAEDIGKQQLKELKEQNVTLKEQNKLLQTIAGSSEAKSLMFKAAQSLWAGELAGRIGPTGGRE